MSLSAIVKPLRSNRVIAVDPASHSLAWAIYDIGYKDSIVIVDYGKIDFSSVVPMSGKFATIREHLRGVCDKYKPTVGVIEQSVFIQNFQASRILSYIIGFTWGELINYCESVEDVNPLQWKSGIGYKNVKKADIQKIRDEFGDRGIQKRLVDERKNRVKAILKHNFDGVDFDSFDSDISDALGIGLWYAVFNKYVVLKKVGFYG